MNTRPAPRRRPGPRRRVAMVLALVAVVAAGCGARLSQAQLAALNSSNNNGGNANSQGIGSSGASSGARSAAGPVTTVGSSSAGRRVRVVTSGSTSGRSATATAGGHAGGAAGGPVIAANDPLAGPGGRVCPTGAPGSGPGVSQSTITIGNIATINGPVPGLFAGARTGTQAFAAWANSIGGLCGRKVVVTSADDQFDQATDQSEASSMAGRVLSFVGSFSLQDSGIPAGAPGVPDVGQTLTSQRFNSPTNFSPQPDAPGFTTGPYRFFSTDPATRSGTQHLAMLVENTPQTIVTGKWEQDALKSIGYHFVFTDTNLQPTDPTFNGDVQKMKAAGVTGVIFQATGAIIGQLANAMYQAGMHINFGNYVSTAYDPAYLQNAGPGAQGTVLEQQLAMYEGEDAATVPMVGTFDQWYSRVDPGHTPDLYAAYGWMSGMLFAEALNAGGAPTRAAMLNGLHQITTFNAGGMSAPSDPVTKTPPSCWIAIDVSNGKFVRDPATPRGFRCSPSGYYREPGA